MVGVSVKHFYHSIPGWFSFAGVYLQAVKRARDGARFVEVGAWKGRSAAFLATEICNSGKQIEFYVVDHWKGSNEPAHLDDPDVKAGTLYEAFMRNTKPVRKYIHILRMSSVEAAAGFDNQSLDLVLLDGGHTYEDVRADIDAWLPKMKPGSVLAGDDWNWKGVHTAVGETFGDKVQVLGIGKGRHWKVEL